MDIDDLRRLNTDALARLLLFLGADITKTPAVEAVASAAITAAHLRATRPEIKGPFDLAPYIAFDGPLSVTLSYPEADCFYGLFWALADFLLVDS